MKESFVARVGKYGKRRLGTLTHGFIARVIDNMGNDGAVEMAGAISYYVILSIFPILLGCIALLGFFLPYAAVQDAVSSFIQRNVSGLAQILQPNIASIIHLRGILSIVSIIGFFWSGSAMFSAVNRAVNRAWEVDHPRQIAVRKLREMAMSISTTLFLVLSMTGTTVLSLFGPGSALIQRIANSLISFVLVFAVFIIIYKWVPNTKTYWRLVWPGALLASVLFEVARTFIGLYFSRFTNFQLVYSTIGAIIVLLVWVYYSTLIMVAGTEVSFEYSRMHLKLPLKRWRLATVNKIE